jgi:hypothetical protein
MLPVFIVWLVRRYRQNQKKNKKIAASFKKIKRLSGPVVSALLFSPLLFIALKSYPQNKVLTYHILRNGK